MSQSGDDQSAPSFKRWPPQPPFKLGEYVVRQSTGLAHFGAQFAAQDEIGVAARVVVFHPSLPEESVARLQKAIDHAADVVHPQLLAVLDHGTHEGVLWVVTPPPPGVPIVRAWRERQDRSEAAVFRILAELLEILTALHDGGSTHGSLGPETLHLVDEQLVVLDPWWCPSGGLPPEEIMAMRKAWVPPEQRGGSPWSGPAADVYAVGLVLGFLMSHTFVESGRSLRSQGGAVSEALDAVFMKATARRPEARYSDLIALERALREAAGASWPVSTESSPSIFPFQADRGLESEPTIEDQVPVHLLTGGAATPEFVFSEDGAKEALPAPALSEEDLRALLGEELHTEGGVPPPLPPAPEAPRLREDRAATKRTPIESILEEDPLESEAVVLPEPARVLESTTPMPGAVGSGAAPHFVFSSDVLPIGTESSQLIVSADLSTVLPEEAPVEPESSWSSLLSADEVLVTGMTPPLSAEFGRPEPTEPSPPPLSAEFGRPEPTEPSPPPLSAESERPAGVAVPFSGEFGRPEPTEPTPPPAGMPVSEAEGEGPAPSLGALAALAAGATEGTPSEAPAAEDTLVATRVAETQLTAKGMGGGARIAIGGDGREHRYVEKKRSLLWLPILLLFLLGAGLTLFFFGGDKGNQVDGAPTAVGVEVASSAGGATAERGLGDEGGEAVAGDAADKGEAAEGSGDGVEASAGDGETGEPVEGAEAGAEGGAKVDADGQDGSAGKADSSAGKADSSTGKADGSAGKADGSAGKADGSAGKADGSAGKADGSAGKVDGSAGKVDGSAGKADGSASKADSSAGIADGSAGKADSSAGKADGSAGKADSSAGKADSSAGKADGSAGGSGSDFVPKDPAKMVCPPQMSKLRRRTTVTLADGSKAQDWNVTCIDRYEYPGAGSRPRVNVDIQGARQACEAKGKRLCTSREWRQACGSRYPYGREYEEGRCNTATADGAPQPVVATGSKRGCMSPAGVFDLVGNVAEWTEDGTVHGGSSLRHSDDATCSQASRRLGGAEDVGFRCCVDAEE